MKNLTRRSNGPQRGPVPCFRSAVREDVLEILIYDEIGYNWWTDGGVTANRVQSQIEQAGAFGKLRMCINSPGGDAFEGIAIYNIARNLGKPVEVRIDGIAASAASIIAMAGDSIQMGPNTMMMIHNPWTVCIGEAKDMRKMADALEKIGGAIAQTYVTRTGKTAEEIAALMDAETWLTAQECVEQGFATGLTTDAAVEDSLALARSFRTLARMKHVPEALKPRAAACACGCEPCSGGDCGGCSNGECGDENCDGCPAQQETSNAAADLSVQEAQLALLKRRGGY